MEDNYSTEFDELVYPIRKMILVEFDNIGTIDEKIYSPIMKIGKCEWYISLVSFNWNNGEGFHAVIKLVDWLESSKWVKTQVTFCFVNQLDGSRTPPSQRDFVFDEFRQQAFSEFFEQRDLVGKGFMKDNKILLECELIIPSDNLPRRSVDFEKTRPSLQDKVIIFQRPTEKDSVITGTSRETFRVDSVTDEYSMSEPFFIRNMQGKIACRKYMENQRLQFAGRFELNPEDMSDWWSCLVSVEFQLINRDDEGRSFSARTITVWLDKDTCHAGMGILEWDTLVAPGNGYVKNGEFILGVRVHLFKSIGFDKKTGQGIDRPMVPMTDAVLVVDEAELNVSTKILSQQSSYFDKLFNEGGNEFTVSDVEFDDFIRCLHLIYNCDTDIDEYNLESVLKIINDIDAPECFEKCDLIMKRQKVAESLKLLPLVDKYPLPELQRKVLRRLNKESTLEEVVKSEEYKKLSAETKVMILEWKVPEELRSEQEEDYDFKFKTDFEESSKHTDVQISVNEIHYHASKQILANASGYFMKEFFGPYATDSSQIELFDIHPSHFGKLLTHIYHPTRPVTSGNVDSLLQLAHKYSVPKLSDKCEEYLVLRHEMPLIDKFEYAGKYDLPFLMSSCLKLIERDNEKNALLEHHKYIYLPPSVHQEIAQRTPMRRPVREPQVVRCEFKKC